MRSGYHLDRDQSTGDELDVQFMPSKKGCPDQRWGIDLIDIDRDGLSVPDDRGFIEVDRLNAPVSQQNLLLSLHGKPKAATCAGGNVGKPL